MVGLRASNAAFLGRVGLTAPVYDTNAQTIITATETADEQVLEAVVRNAINSLVIGCKVDGIWPFLSAGVFRLLAGPRTIAGIQKCGVGADPQNVGVVIGDHIRSLGPKGDGIGKYFNINRNNNADGQNDRCSAIWVSQSQTGGFGIYIGAGVPTDTGSNYLGHNSSAPEIASRNLNSDPSSIIPSSASVTGFVGNTRDSSTSYVTRFGGTNYTRNLTSFTIAAGQTNLFARNLAAPAFSNARIGFYYKGPALPTGGLALLEARVAAYMTAIAGI